MCIRDRYEDGIGTYLVKLSSKSLSMDDSRSVSRLLHSISDFERISDHAKSIQISAQRLRDKGQTFSKDAQAELEVLFRAVRQVTRLTANSFIANDPEQAKLVEPLEQVVDHLCATMKAVSYTHLVLSCRSSSATWSAVSSAARYASSSNSSFVPIMGRG